MIVVQPDDLQLAADALATGEVIAVPTDTVYGVAVLASVPGAADLVFAAKQRPRDVTLPVLVSGADQALRIAKDIGEVERAWMDAFWPGALTIVVDRATDFHADLGDNRQSVGIRCPANPAVRQLCTDLGPLAVTSANLHKQPPATSVKEVVDAFGGRIRVVVDGGECRGVPSTVARWNRGAGWEEGDRRNKGGRRNECEGPHGREVQVLREGAISQSQLSAVANLAAR